MLLCVGFVAVGWVVSFTFAFIFGNISDVVMTYLMQIWFLNDKGNRIVYFGVSLVIVACCILLAQEYCKEQNNVEQLSLSQLEGVDPLDDQDEKSISFVETTPLKKY